MSLSFTLFQEPWWLSAVTGNNYQEATVAQRGHIIGRLPYVTSRHAGFNISILPPFTHILGPAVENGDGKSQTQLVRRLSIVRDLIDKLPSFAYFKYVFDPSLGDGLAYADGLAFQDRGFDVVTQYTFHIDARERLSRIWDGMHTTVRQHIRRSEQLSAVSVLDDPSQFVDFYLHNLKKVGRRNRTNFSNFGSLYSQCLARKCGEILCASSIDGGPVAMAFLVWGHGTMYYLLSTRAPDASDKGAVSSLLWSAIKRANELGLKFDFDGVYSSGTARFLAGFGGTLGVRLIATRARPIYGTLRALRQVYTQNNNEKFA